MERWRGQALRILVGAATIAALTASGADAKGKLKAEIIRSKGGIPTIRADDFKSLGFGYGYAFAEDNICTIAEAYVTSNGERSRYFGPGGDSPDGYTNLQSDLFYQRIKDTGIIDDVLAEPPPVGPKKKVFQAVKGYVAGYNRYLDKTGVANLSDPTCAGQPWVRDITTARRLAALLPAGPARQRAGRRGRDRRRRPAQRRRDAARAGAQGRRRRARRGARRGAAVTRAPTAGAWAARRPRTAAAWCSATRTSRGRAPSASTSRTSWSRARSTSPAPASSACR